MPGKFKSVLVKKQERLPDGTVHPGVTAWIPVNEAAKASPQAEKAVEEGVYTPKDGEEPRKMAEKLRKREAELAAKGAR